MFCESLQAQQSSGGEGGGGELNNNDTKKMERAIWIVRVHVYHHYEGVVQLCM